MTCPTQPAHGRLYPLPSGRWFCSHHEHDEGTPTRALFDPHEVFPELPRPREVRAPLRTSRRRVVEGG